MNPKRTDNHGSLSRNKRKEKETHPSHKGSCTVAGREYWISAWVNENRENGEKYFKLYFEPKKQTELPIESTPLPAAPAPVPLEGQPDIPF